MDKPKQAIVDSIHQQLLNKARDENRPFNELLQYYAMEKFLLRLSKLPQAGDFVLKGALLLRARGITDIRPTRDIDFLRYGDSRISAIEKILADACRVDIEDGLMFDTESVQGRKIREQEAYDGVRVTVDGRLGNARIKIQIDIGFGDVITPGPLWLEYTAILDDEYPRLKAYTLESSIAEKYQAMVKLDLANSRMKDFYDIYLLTESRPFEGRRLQKAIQNTFEHRETEIPMELPIALTEEFAEDESKTVQWNAFLNKLSDKQIPNDLAEVVERLANFFWPVTEAIKNGDTFKNQWTAGKKWKPKE
jgi:predicted nucleotidyltransferase component of viral defense system